MAQLAVSVLGDSISTFAGFVSAENRVYYEGGALERTGVRSVEQTWWMRVIERMGARLLANGSFSGSMVEGAGFPAACSWRRVEQLAGAHGEAPDVILAFMGINDYGWGGAFAQAAGRSAAMPACMEGAAVPERVAGAADAHAVAGFAQAYGGMLSALRLRYPRAQVWCLTLVPGRLCGMRRSTFCYRLRGVELDAYNDAIRAAARTCGCCVADMRALGFDYETVDGTHPTARGMEQLAAMALAAMALAAMERAGGAGVACGQSEVGGHDGVRVGGAGVRVSAGAALGAAGGELTADVDVRADEAREKPAAGGLSVAGGNGEGAPAALDASLFPASMASARLCDKPLCVGCPHAHDTGNAWSCLCERDLDER